MKRVTVLILLIAQACHLYGYPMETSKSSPEELGGHFEGDMMLDGGQVGRLMMKAGLSTERYRWQKNQNGTVIVHYTIREGSPYSKMIWK
jgi:hypothetical protein